jgi:hypothetical protein
MTASKREISNTASSILQIKGGGGMLAMVETLLHTYSSLSCLSTFSTERELLDLGYAYLRATTTPRLCYEELLSELVFAYIICPREERIESIGGSEDD